MYLQNQYGDNFHPRRSSNTSSQQSQGTSRYCNNTNHYVRSNPPANIQVFHNDGHSQERQTENAGRNQYHANQQDQASASTMSLLRYSSQQYPPTNSYYQGQHYDNYIYVRFFLPDPSIK